MSTIEIAPPVIPPISDEDFGRFWREIYGTEMEPYPVAHLVGKLALEDRVAAAEDKFEHGNKLSQTERELLQLAQETFFDEDIIL